MRSFWVKEIGAVAIVLALLPLLPGAGSSAALKSCSDVIPVNAPRLATQVLELSSGTTRIYATSSQAIELSHGDTPAEQLILKNGRLQWLGNQGVAWPNPTVLNGSMLLWHAGKTALFYAAGASRPCLADYMFEAQDSERYRLENQQDAPQLRPMEAIEAMLAGRFDDLLSGNKIALQFDPDKTPVWPAVDQALAKKPWTKQIVASPLRHGLRGPQLHIARRAADAAQTYNDVNPLVYQTQITQNPPVPVQRAGFRFTAFLDEGRSTRLAHAKASLSLHTKLAITAGGTHVSGDFTPIAMLEGRFSGPHNSLLQFSAGRLGRAGNGISLSTERSFQGGQWHGAGQLGLGQDGQSLGFRALRYNFTAHMDLGLSLIANRDSGVWGYSAAAALYYGDGPLRPVMGAALSTGSGPEIFAGLQFDFGPPRTDFQAQLLAQYSGLNSALAVPFGGWSQDQLPDLRSQAIRRDWRHIARLP